MTMTMTRPNRGPTRPKGDRFHRLTPDQVKMDWLFDDQNPSGYLLAIFRTMKAVPAIPALEKERSHLRQ